MQFGDTSLSMWIPTESKKIKSTYYRFYLHKRIKDSDVACFQENEVYTKIGMHYVRWNRHMNNIECHTFVAISKTIGYQNHDKLVGLDFLKSPLTTIWNNTYIYLGCMIMLKETNWLQIFKGTLIPKLMCKWFA